jgi:hypothetical protein
MMNGSAIRTGACLHRNEKHRCDQVRALNSLAAVEMVEPDNSRSGFLCKQANTT